MADQVLLSMRQCVQAPKPHRRKRFVLTGNSGTGKSAWLNYMMLRCHQEGITVIYHATCHDTIVTLLQPGKPARTTYTLTPRQVLHELQERGVDRSKVLYLCETGGAGTLEPQLIKCATVLTSKSSHPHTTSNSSANPPLCCTGARGL